MQGPEKEVLTRWELTNEEKIALLSGGQIYLSLWTFGSPLQPIRLRVAHPEEIIEEYGMLASAIASHPNNLGIPCVDSASLDIKKAMDEQAKAINSVEPINPEVEKALDEKFPDKECEYEH